MKNCRECKGVVSEQAPICPHCGAPRPAKESWDGWGWEYKSRTYIGGLPLLHIAFKYRATGRPVVAKGVIAIGQFGAGIITISQFGIGFVSISQFTVAAYAVAQFALAYSCIAQIGVYVNSGWGQAVTSVSEALEKLSSTL